MITVSRNTKSGIEDDARQQEYAEDPSAATNIAVALQLLTHEDGHQSASLKCTAGLVEDRLASHRGVSRLDFLPTLQLPFPFLVSMRLAEYAEADKYLFLSASNERSGKAATGPYAVQWDEGAEDDALTHAAASLYEGSPATTSPQIKDSRDLLSYFTNPRAAERIVSDIVTLPTILVPERAGKARDMADAFVTRSVEGSKPSAARMGGEDEHILYGYHTLVQQQLQEKSTDVMVHSNLQGRPSVVKYEGRSEDLAALAGTVSLAALWEEAGMSVYELAMYGTGKVGTIALNYSAGSQSAVGRVVEATTPIASESNTHVDPLNSYLAPISVLAKHAARTCQRLAPSYIAQELERQRLDNVLAMAADRAVEDERTFKSHTAKIRDAVQIRAGPRSSANATNLADALLNDDIPAIANRMAHGKAQFDHLVRVGRKRLEEDEVAQTFASQNSLPAVRVAGPVEQPAQGMLVVRNRLNLSAPLIGHAHKAPTVEERRAKQEQQLARRLEARDLSRAMNLTQSGGAALEALIEPNNRMSLFVLKTLRPELRKLNAEERQLLEEKTLVTRLGEACATEKDEQTSHLDRSRESRNKTRDVTAEAADTMATEKSLMDRKGKVRQTERLREGALTGSLQRLLVDHEAKNHPSQAPPVSMVSASTSPLPLSQDDRLLGFEHLMSRDRAAAYNT